MRRVVRGFWGPRQESAEELAARWSTTLERFAALLPEAAAGRAAGARAAGQWRTAPASGPAVTLRPEAAPLLDALRTAREADPWAAANGTSLRLLADAPAPGWKVEIAALAGGTPDSLPQSLVATITSPDGAAPPDAALLTAVAEVWDPDHGDVGDRTVTAALKQEAGFKVGTPSVGWIGYLSAGRAARVPADLRAERAELPTGGLLLTLAPPGDTAAVVEAYETLRKSGALEPLPRPMNRPAL
ncbi:hypothetical protein [Streptomyces pilosus]|uniref:hypothetical protein n=1 Tax=Streptomyces pilosus TaxID=28893 RepID=UPI0036FCD6D3